MGQALSPAEVGLWFQATSTGGSFMEQDPMFQPTMIANESVLLWGIIW